MQRVLVASRPRFDRAELTLWRALRDALAARDLQLVIASSLAPPADLEVEHVTTSGSLDTFCAHADAPQVPVALLGEDEDLLLHRHAIANGPPLVAAVDRLRREAMRRLSAQQLAHLQVVRPVLTIAWNGPAVDQHLLAAASLAGGTPVLYADRAGIADTLMVSDEPFGPITTNASRAPLAAPAEEWRALAQGLCDQLSRGRTVWWEQPRWRSESSADVRSALGIPTDARVLLIAPPADEDDACQLGPGRRSPLECFDWLLEYLALCPGIYVLGRQHPRSRIPAARYAERLARSGVPGTWREDLSLEDALLAADRVAAAESSVLVEALARQRPALAMSDWLLSGQGAAYDAVAQRHAAVYEWLAAHQFPSHLSRFRDALGALLSHSLYAQDSTTSRAGMLNLDDLAARVQAKATATPWRMPDQITHWLLRRHAVDSAWVPDGASEPRHDVLQRLQEWELAHALRSALLPAYHAARDGREVRVWGSATARQAVIALLGSAGAVVDPHARTASAAQAPGSDFIVVATAAHDETTQQLESMGLVRGSDYSVVEPQLLHALRVRERVRGDAA